MSNLEVYTTLAVAILGILQTFDVLTGLQVEELQRNVILIVEVLVAVGWLSYRRAKTK